MKVKSYITNQSWLDGPANTDGAPIQTDHALDPADREIFRLLSDITRSTNLVVLAGLGTSLCVNAHLEAEAPTMQVLWDAVQSEYETHPPEEDSSWDQLLSIARHPTGNTDIEDLLSRCKVAESFVTGADLRKLTLFIRQAEQTIRTKVDFLSPSDTLPVHESFLRRLARRSVRRQRLKLFTTNYDNCYEHAARRAGFVVIDGFTFAQPSVFDPMLFSYDIVRRSDDSDALDYIENLFHLYKMHGSIDWEFDHNSKRINKSQNTDMPLLIYPRNNKYELAFAQPYLEMLSRFQASIRERETGLLIIGFGFNDSHIAEPVLAAIETNLAMNVVIVSPSIDVDSDTNPFLSRISKLIDQGDARIGLIAGTFEDLVPKIPDVTAMTDLERHVERLRVIQEQ